LEEPDLVDNVLKFVLNFLTHQIVLLSVM